ncbi:44815_t:CDS:1, partial [Gigaspora margarita]
MVNDGTVREKMVNDMTMEENSFVNFTMDTVKSVWAKPEKLSLFEPEPVQ